MLIDVLLKHVLFIHPICTAHLYTIWTHSRDFAQYLVLGMIFVLITGWSYSYILSYLYAPSFHAIAVIPMKQAVAFIG